MSVGDVGICYDERTIYCHIGDQYQSLYEAVFNALSFASYLNVFDLIFHWPLHHADQDPNYMREDGDRYLTKALKRYYKEIELHPSTIGILVMDQTILADKLERMVRKSICFAQSGSYSQF